MIIENIINHIFLNSIKPSPIVSQLYTTDILARAGRATKSRRVSPVMLPAECLPTSWKRPEEI